jgi:hypothetical protein
LFETNYAFIKNGNIINIVIIDEPTEELLNFLKIDIVLDDILPATDKAIIGGTYDGTKFWPPQPYPSWLKDEYLNEWVAPISQPEFDPENPIFYVWNEEILNWEEISE